jgi:serine/threonine-protein kinase
MSEPQRRVGERYEVLGRLSAGPGGDIWGGRDLLTGSGCALRVLEPGFAADPVAGFEFLGVLGRIGRLAHPAIVAVSDVVTGDGCSALVMRLISGESLRARLDRLGPLETAEAAELVAQLCDALSAAHAAGLAHGRVKPSNVMLEPGADALTVKVTDFGMAVLDGRNVNGAAHSLAAAIEAAQYRAPELGPVNPATETLAIAPPSTAPPSITAPSTAPSSTPPPISTAADVYAAGVVLYEALAGHPPFTGMHPDEIARLHRESPPPRIPGLPDAIWPLLTACLAKQPHLRPAAGDLASLLRGIAPSAPRRAEREVLTATAIVDPPRSEPQPPQKPAMPTAVITPAFTRRSAFRARRAEFAVTAGLTVLICGFAYMLGGAAPLNRPEIGSAVLPGTDAATRAASVTGTGGSGSASASPDASAGPSSSAAASNSPSLGTSANASASTSTGPALPAGATTSAAALSSSPTPSKSASSVATSPAATPVSGLPIADPIAFLETLRAKIQALVAQGRATIDPNAAGDLENLVLDLENSVIAYQQNGGAAHLTEIKNKITAFDARLASLVADGRISPGAALQLATYLQQLSPS